MYIYTYNIFRYYRENTSMQYKTEQFMAFNGSFNHQSPNLNILNILNYAFYQRIIEQESNILCNYNNVRLVEVPSATKQL